MVLTAGVAVHAVIVGAGYWIALRTRGMLVGMDAKKIPATRVFDHSLAEAVQTLLAKYVSESTTCVGTVGTVALRQMNLKLTN